MKIPPVLFENEDFVVLDKPAGLLSVPDRIQSAESLKEMLQKKYGQIFTVHRLDRETSGVILYAKSEAAHKYFSGIFEDRNVEKYYQGLVHGSLQEKKGTIREPMAEHPAKNGKMVVYRKGKPAVTDYEVVEEFALFSFLRFRIHTGRTHQIRVHMQHLGHPIVCDELYGSPEPVFLSSFKRNFKPSGREEEEERPLLGRLALHAAELIFTDPAGRKFELKAELPKDLRAVLQQLRKWGSG